MQRYEWKEREAYIRAWLYDIERIKEALLVDDSKAAMDSLFVLQCNMHEQLTNANIIRDKEDATHQEPH